MNNSYMVAALNALSHVNIKKNYKLIRKARRIARKPKIKLYQTWDYSIKCRKRRIPVRIFSPCSEFIPAEDMRKYPVIVFFHGGGWVTGDLDTYEKTCLTIARQTDHVVVAVQYRLAPEHPFPAGLSDCCAAVKTISRLCKKGDEFKKITLMGDSAGGNLVAAVCLYMRDRGKSVTDIVERQILIYPATYNDHTKNSPFKSVKDFGKDYILTSQHIRDYMDMYCMDMQYSREKSPARNSPYLAPLLAKDLSGLPQTLIITAEFDPLRDEGEEYGRRLREAGNTVEVHRIGNALHGYFALSIRYSLVKETYDIINNFIRGDFNGQSSRKKVV